MKYWRGYLTAAIFGALTWILMQFGQRFSTLVDMVYPYVIRTLQGILADWSSGVDYCLWQMVAIVLGILVLASVVLMIVLKWNPIQWFGWVLAGASCLFLCNTLVFGLNLYAGPLAEDIRLDVVAYNVDELTEAATYYRDKANELATQVDRDENGNVQFDDFAALSQQAADGFQSLVHDYSYPIFAGSTLPVKELGWANMYTSMGVTGVTMGLTGEAAVNPQIPDICLPFTMCHEMAHRMCIASERDGNLAAFLACQANDSVEFQYSAYFMAYRYCYSALAGDSSVEASGAAARVLSGVNDQLYQDLTYYADFFNENSGKSGGKQTSGTTSYGEVCDLLVSWHIQQVVLPSITVEEQPFDPFDETQVDLSGLVNANQQETQPNE